MKKLQTLAKNVCRTMLLAGLVCAATMTFAQELERRGANNKCGYVAKGAKAGFMGWKFVIKDNYTCSSKEFDEKTNLAVVQSVSNERWGVINKKGEVVIPMEYQEGLDIKNGKVIAKKDGKWGLLDTEGKILLPLEYDYMNGESTEKTNVLLARKGDRTSGKYGFIDYSGKIIVPIEYDLIKFVPMSISNGSRHYNMKKDGKFGLYGLDEGKFLTDVKYDAEIWFTSTKLPLVYKGKMDGDEYEISETGVEKYLGAGTPKSNSSASSSSSSSSSAKTTNTKNVEAEKTYTFTCSKCGKTVTKTGSGTPSYSGCFARQSGDSRSHIWKKQ